MKIIAQWDTGAGISVITPKIAKILDLVAKESIHIDSVGISGERGIVKITICLPNEIRYRELTVAICEFNSDAYMLIGMDIIQQGDFSISNKEGRTLLSFVYPSFNDTTDLYEKANNINKQNGF
jgi:hypothetical protein